MKRGNMLINEVLPLPERPTKASFSPALMCKLKSSKAFCFWSLYNKSMCSNFKSPRARAICCVPVLLSDDSSIRPNTLSAETNIFCMGALTLDKLLSGLIICSMAMMNAIKPPTVVVPCWLCHKATKITTANANDAINSLIGDLADEARAKRLA